MEMWWKVMFLWRFLVDLNGALVSPCLFKTNLRVEYVGYKHIKALFGWRIQPESASHNSIFLSREISQSFNQQYFPLTRNQPASQPNKASINLPAAAGQVERVSAGPCEEGTCAPCARRPAFLTAMMSMMGIDQLLTWSALGHVWFHPEFFSKNWWMCEWSTK